MNLVLGTVSKQLDVAGLAVGIVAVLLECAFVEQLETEGTLKVVWVEGVECACMGRGRKCVYMEGVEYAWMRRRRMVYMEGLSVHGRGEGGVECAWTRRGRGGVCMDKEGRMVYKEGVECACMGRGRVCIWVECVWMRRGRMVYMEV